MNWPSEESLDELTERAGGLFIYASTVMKFISARGAIPEARLRTILDRSHRSGGSTYRQLDAIYDHVLQTAVPADLEPEEQEERIRRLRFLLGVLVVLRTPMSFSVLAELLEVEEHILRAELDAVSAVVLVPEKHDDAVELFHASFPEYLSDVSRCTAFGGRIAVCPEESHAHLAVHAVTTMMQATDSKSDRSGAFNYCGELWWYHCERASAKAVRGALDLLRRHMQQFSWDHPLYLLHAQAFMWGSQKVYDKDGDLRTLEECVSLARRVLERRNIEDYDRSRLLDLLAGGLLLQYRQHSNTTALNEVIGLYREALGLCPVGHHNHSVALNNLANALLDQYKESGDEAMLREAVALHRKSLSLRPPGTPFRDSSLTSLAFALNCQYGATGDEAMLTEAITLGQEALGLRIPGHPARDYSLSILATSMIDK
jgi:hypothetical protein